VIIGPRKMPWKALTDGSSPATIGRSGRAVAPKIGTCHRDNPSQRILVNQPRDLRLRVGAKRIWIGVYSQKASVEWTVRKVLAQGRDFLSP